MAKRVALYLRSSKDKHDVSVESQRRILEQHVTSCGDIVVHHFVDKVESAKTANRPAFQEMMSEVKSKKCRFQCIYCYDTSRFSRRMYDAQLYKHLLKKNDIELLFLKLPKSDPLMDSVLESLMEIFDEFHSQKSKMDGLRGMRENVNQGWRAGGQAPVGYKLDKTVVGTRDGEPITKSKLIPDQKTFHIIQQYLQGRAKGVARVHLVEELGMTIPKSSLVYLEEGALTYAGHTVWNRHNETIDGKYKGGKRYRDRKEWVIQRDTHQAMITDEEAETLLRNREKDRAARQRRRISTYLLTGVVKCRCGANLCGEGGYYRCPKRCGNRGIKKETLEQVFINLVFEKLFSSETIEELKEAIRKKSLKSKREKPNRKEELNKQLKTLEKEIEGIIDLVQQVTHKRTLLSRIDALEEERTIVEDELNVIAKSPVANAVNAKRKDISRFLKDYKKKFQDSDIQRKKAMIMGLISSAILDSGRLMITPCYDSITEHRLPSKKITTQIAADRR